MRRSAKQAQGRVALWAQLLASMSLVGDAMKVAVNTDAGVVELTVRAGTQTSGLSRRNVCVCKGSTLLQGEGGESCD